jgi:hypothetical protein
VKEAVDKLYEFYSFSIVLRMSVLLSEFCFNTLEKYWSRLLDTLCQDDAIQGLRDNLAFAKQLAQIFDFVFHFDEAKMVNPAIQNDFSYYRRVLGRMKNLDKETKHKVSNFCRFSCDLRIF